MRTAYIFDIGNVLAEFDGKKLIRTWIRDEEQAKALFAFLFKERWNRYDQGLISTEEIAEQAAAAFPSIAEEIQKMMKEWPEHLTVNTKNLEEIRGRNLNAYILSNLPECTETSLRKRGMFDGFAGGVFSWREKRCKPDPILYQILLDRYNLKAEDCVFIDDREENVQAAKELGMQAYRLEQIDLLSDLLDALDRS